MKTVTICSSVNFYRHVIELRDELERLGWRVLVPHSAEKMAKTGDFDADKARSWQQDERDYHKKTDLMRKHFAKVSKADAVLVVNNRKHDTDNYIGGNVLMEMALAFHLNKPIFLLNDLPKVSHFLEEIRGMQPVALHGDVRALSLATETVPADS